MHYFGGLDIGTTHTKLVICTPSLEIVFQGKLGYSLGFGATLDAEEIYSHTRQLLDEAGRLLDFSTNHLTVSFSAAMHSIMLVNKAAVPLTPLYTWADTSSLPVMEHFKNNPLTAGLFFETGTPLHPMSPFCKLAWMRLSIPDVLDQAYKCIGIKELVWYRITGEWEIDYSLASATGLFSQILFDWNAAAIKLAGIMKDQLSLPVPVTRKICKGNSTWVIGASDGCLAQLGSGAMEKGTAALTIGTSGAIRITLPALRIDKNRELFTYMLDESHFVCGGSTNNGGIALQWWEQQVMEKDAGLDAVINSFAEAVAAAKPGCDGMVCLPYFGGERAPVWDADAKGIFWGVTNRHGQPAFKRAILEGIGFAFRRLLEKLETAGGNIDIIYASGGFSHAGWWVQLMADILRKPLLVRAEDVDASAIGAIAIGMKAEGFIQSYAAFSAKIPLDFVRFTPDNSAEAIYNTNYKQFLRLCQS